MIQAAHHRFLIVADGEFDPLTSKTANSCLRYFPERIVAVLDRRHAGATVQDVLGYGGAIPVVATLDAGLAHHPTALLIGIAPRGGQLPPAWRPWLRTAIEQGLEVWSGLHAFVGDDPELGPLAAAHGVRLLDARRPPPDLPVAEARAADVDSYVVLTVGSDCSVGKMTTQLELRRALTRRGHRARFVATGQTGIFIDGAGIAVDAVPADFVAGAAETLVLEAARDADIVLVEGQGSLIHPGYSGVTLGLMHGAAPAAMILCHEATRRSLGDYRARGSRGVIPPLPDLVDVYQRAAAWVRPAPVIAVALNTLGLDESAARAAIQGAHRETGLPVTDPVRFGAEALADAVIRGARSTD